MNEQFPRLPSRTRLVGLHDGCGGMPSSAPRTGFRCECLVSAFMDVASFMAAAGTSAQITELTHLWAAKVQGARQCTRGEWCRTEPHPACIPPGPTAPSLRKHREDVSYLGRQTELPPRTPHQAPGHPPLAPTHLHTRGQFLTFLSQTRPKMAADQPSILHTAQSLSSGTGILLAFCSGSRICFEALNR